MSPGIIKDTDEWLEGYKLRAVVEKNIEYIKDPLNCGNLKTQNRKTIKSDAYLASITQLIALTVAYNMHKHDYIRSLRFLIKTSLDFLIHSNESN